MVGQQKVGDQGNFPQMLDAMIKAELISKNESSILQAALDAGSAAAHRGYSPTSESLNDVMDIVEHLLKSVFVLPKVAEKLKKSTPQRTKPVT